MVKKINGERLAEISVCEIKRLTFDSFLLFIHIPAFPKATVKKIFAERRNAACKRCRRRFFK